MSTKPEAGSPNELAWLRGFEEARNHFLDEIKKLEVKIASLEKDEKMFLNEHDENVRLHFENVDLKEQNTQLRKALEKITGFTESDFMGKWASEYDLIEIARNALKGKI